MATYGISLLTLVPVRKSPGDRNEMVNQLLFGDFVEIKDTFEDWYLIETIDDGYEGWVDKKQIQQVKEETFNLFLPSERYFTIDLLSTCTSMESSTEIQLVMGSQLPHSVNNILTIENNSFSFHGNFISATKKPQKVNIKKTALAYLNAPYLWGGKSPFGIDCSGFVQMVYKISGIFLKRDASQQAQQGELVNFVHETHLGDLAFFENDEGRFVHVGIMLDNEHIIHASGKVRIDKIDHNGIYNEQERKYTHRLRLIKRIFEE
jgi:hypothetical protein